MQCKFHVGQTVEDSHTGFTGTVSGIYFDANGCQINVESMHDGKLVRHVFEEVRLDAMADEERFEPVSLDKLNADGDLSADLVTLIDRFNDLEPAAVNQAIVKARAKSATVGRFIAQLKDAA